MEFALPEPVLECLNRLNQAGFAAYAVGGCVRDHVLGVQPHDYDICTAARPEAVEAVKSTLSSVLKMASPAAFCTARRLCQPER